MPEPTSETGALRQRVLIVEPHETSRSGLELILRTHHSMEVEAHQRAADALESASRQTFHALVLDVADLVSDTTAFLQLLRTQPQAVVVWTAATRTQDLGWLPGTLVEKPVVAEVLVGLINGQRR